MNFEFVLGKVNGLFVVTRKNRPSTFRLGEFAEVIVVHAFDSVVTMMALFPAPGVCLGFGKENFLRGAMRVSR